VDGVLLTSATETNSQLHSHLEQVLNGDPAASPTRRRAQTWCSLFVAPCAPEGTPPACFSAAALLDSLFEQSAVALGMIPSESQAYYFPFRVLLVELSELFTSLAFQSRPSSKTRH